MIKLHQVIALQDSENLNDTEFALRLGYRSRFAWNRVKNGKCPFNDRFLMKVLRAFPDINKPVTTIVRPKIEAKKLNASQITTAKLNAPLFARTIRRLSPAYPYHNFHNAPHSPLSQILRPFGRLWVFIIGRQGK